jgi:UDP-N-acetylglucosamine transferase subunit ALG13
MIFVTVGTNEARFDRLLQAVASLDLDEPCVVQHGHSTPVAPDGATLVDFLSFEEMNETIAEARAVVTHAGVGSIMVSLANGKRPIVWPRRSALGEAVDDHQLQIGHRFADADLVALVEAVDDLRRALTGDQRAAHVVPTSSSLAVDLGRFVAQTIGRPPLPVQA